MRRLPFILLALLLTHTAIAGVRENDPREKDPAARFGRAMILQPAQPLTAADRAELAAQGVEIRHALAGGRYLTRVREGASAKDVRVGKLEPLTTDLKIHPSARRMVGRGRTWADVHVVFHRDVDFEDARQAILAAGGTIDPFKLRYSPSHRIEARIAPVALEALASDERVLTVAGVRNWKVETDNAVAAQISRVDEVHAAPYGLTGAGVTVSLFELAAAQQDHPEFGGRLTVHAMGGSSGDKQHATHVAGTIAAAGLNAEAKGMAPGVTIHQNCVRTGGNDCTNDWLSTKANDLKSVGVIVDNNSWGYVLGWSDEDYPVWTDTEEYFGAYDLIVGAPLDEISNEQGILFIHSAGNDADGQSFATEYSEHRHVDELGDTVTDKLFCYSRLGTGTDCPAACNGGCEVDRHGTNVPYDTIGVTAGAKNIITVGAISGNSLTGNLQIVGFSSRGPAKDGRIKPEVVARGASVLSTVPTGNYGRLSGTSMASPVVAGIAALLTEQWRKTFNGADPTPAQLKAVIIAGARDLGNAGPDYTYGFGVVDAKNSADLIIADAAKGAHIRGVTLDQGGTSETRVTLAQPQNLRVLLNWADPAIPYLGGDDIATKALVNDLDVKVIDPAGNEHFPWVLNREAFRDEATRGVNNTDNVEMIEITGATAGTYRIVVTGTNVAEGPQSAVLVSSAPAVAAAPPCVDPQERNGASNDTAGTASGNLVSGALVTAAICVQGDVDFYKFSATKSGPVTVTIAAGDTPLRATLTGNGVNATTDIAANATATLNANAATAPLALTLRVEATGEVGSAPTYTITPDFGVTVPARRRSVR